MKLPSLVATDNHDSGCSMHNGPAMPAGECDCSLRHSVTVIPPSGLAIGDHWQPIETAPMDGTEVILFYPHLCNDGFVTAGYFHGAQDDYESHWYADLVNGGASPPTHWKPMPKPPAEHEK